MRRLLNIVTPLHKKTGRNCLRRMQDHKVECSIVARKFGRDFWDGKRKYGYGGYCYDGRWEPVASNLVKLYKLNNNSKILDAGCGKGYLLYELKKILPGVKVRGFDISNYGIKNSKKEIRRDLFVHDVRKKLPFGNREFDLVISLSTLHNLSVYELKIALREIERVGRNKYITVESYRNVKELFNLQCWALTCESFFTPKEWVWLFNEFGYTGDYEFSYF